MLSETFVLDDTQIVYFYNFSVNLDDIIYEGLNRGSFVSLIVEFFFYIFLHPFLLIISFLYILTFHYSLFFILFVYFSLFSPLRLFSMFVNHFKTLFYFPFSRLFVGVLMQQKKSQPSHTSNYIPFYCTLKRINVCVTNYKEIRPSKL